MKAIMYMYDIPTTVSPKNYPGPTGKLRKFAARIEYSCWVVPEGLIGQTAPVTEALRRVGATVEMMRFDESEERKILTLARRSIEREAERIRLYIEKSVATTAKKLAEARTQMSINETNAAIRFQQTAIQRATAELNDAESCAIVFDLLGDIGELVRSVRATVVARATAFTLEKKDARKAVKDGDAAATDEAADAAETATATLPFGQQATGTDDEEGDE